MKKLKPLHDWLPMKYIQLKKLPELLVWVILSLTSTWANAGNDAQSCDALRNFKELNTIIQKISHIKSNEVRSDGFSMPAHCLIQGEMFKRIGHDNVGYSIGFELRMPLTWNHRFVFQGGGGVDGVLRPALGALRPGVIPALSQGAAVVSSDMGHQGSSNRDARFGLDSQARIDWGYNALDKVTLISKEIMRHFYGELPQFAYFIGASGGGRQGMILAQRFPKHFDGIVTGAPILEQHLAQIGSIQMLQEFTVIAPKNENGERVLSKSFSDSDLKLIAAGVMRRCDQLDGIVDGLIENYAACEYSVKELQCKNEKNDACLSAEQVHAFDKVMAGPRSSNGTLLYPPIPWDSIIGEESWRANMIGSSPTGISNGSKSTNQSIKYVFMTPPDPNLDYLKFDLERDAEKLMASAKFSASNDVNYAGFKERNGKHLVYVGMGDPLINPAGVIRWYQQLAKANEGLSETQKFARLFIVPGMSHTTGGRALDVFDPVSAIYDWVENNRAPEELIATGSAFPGRKRAICMYPKIAKYKGTVDGSADHPSNFQCEMP
ncbi:MAG: tannase/feruloyl esterase family alpha/beta hydrolase [Betaproteobacteria bacterium]|nr:tannase/feruloyl esterase family alpha/beta hydrolase [Betaproteobacteria bacterium]